MFKTLKVNYKFKQGQAEHLVYVLVVLIVFILISLVCINSYHGCTETVYLNRFFNLRKKPLTIAEASNGTNKEMFVVHFWLFLQWMEIVNGKFLTLHSNCFLTIWCMSMYTETMNSLRIINLISPCVHVFRFFALFKMPLTQCILVIVLVYNFFRLASMVFCFSHCLRWHGGKQWI